MKFEIGTKRQRTVALFGRARLVRNRQGRYELQGGSRADHSEAKEWISLFMHEAVPMVQSTQTPIVIDARRIAD